MEVPEGRERGFAFDPTSICANPQGDPVSGRATNARITLGFCAEFT
jgi:hypothetical protein